MNKDIIYIEPEDDITDIVTKIENSQSKIVAIIPPKKADILHSSINIRLIDKASKNASKKVVLVTTDPTVVKHAASVKMPITKDLQSAPVIPSIEDVEEDEEKPEETEEAEKSEEAEDEEFDELKNKKGSKKKAAKEDEEKPEETEEAEKSEEAEVETTKEETEEKAEEKDDKKSKKDKKKGGKDNWFKKHRKLIYIGSPAILILGIVLYWALAIAPAVEIKVKVRTTPDKFNENINFTTNITEEDISAGKFFLDEKKIEAPESLRFTATGTKNVGEKATGSVIIYHYFNQSGRIAVNANSSFTSQNLTFYSNEDVDFGWDGKNVAECGNNNDPSLVTSGCLIYARVNVTAAGAGSEYNIAQTTSWTTTANVGVYSDAAMSGGTDRTITVVQESDVKAAKEQLTGDKATRDGYKDKLYEEIGEDVLVIESSYSQKTSDIISVPGIGEEVAEGVEPVITTTTTTSVYVVDLSKIREYITAKAKLPEKNLIYAIGNPFVENFTNVEGGFVGRLKTNYTYGPKLSEQAIIELVKGIRIGNVKPILTDEGATDVEITRSYPWVNSVPNDVNKITVTIKEE